MSSCRSQAGRSTVPSSKRGISYTPQGGTQYWRIVPVFETGADKYVWLNIVVAVGVHRTLQGKVAYRQNAVTVPGRGDVFARRPSS